MEDQTTFDFENKNKNGPEDAANNHSSRQATTKTRSSSSWTESLWYRYYRYTDEQRLHRLVQCLPLEKALEDCRLRAEQQRQLEQKQKDGREEEEQQQQERQQQQQVPRLNQMYKGRFMTDYFHFTEGKVSEEAERMARVTCAREEHSLWARRSMALKCGNHLVNLRRCFQHHTVEEVLSAPRTAYERRRRTGGGGSGSGEYLSDMDEWDSIITSGGGMTTTTAAAKAKKIPCEDLQAELGSCVAENVMKLYERRQYQEEEESS